MKRVRLIISLGLAIIILLTKLIFPGLFGKIKAFITKSLSIYMLSCLFIGSPNLYDQVSKTNEITVMDYQRKDNGIYVRLLNNKVTIPFNGIVIKRSNDMVGIEVSDDIIFYLEVNNSSCLLYSYVDSTTVIAKQNEYFIFSNNIKNLEYLNYRISYNEV